jgi:hypothetical protein
MFDLLLVLRQAIEDEMQVEADIVGSQPLFRDFLVLGLCNGNGDVDPWVYPYLGRFCKV